MLGVAVLMCFFWVLAIMTLVFIRMGDRVVSRKHLGALKMGDFGIAKVLSCTLACVGPSGFSCWFRHLWRRFEENSEQ